jgi:Fur family ferric uptake transcriptional regulator
LIEFKSDELVALRGRVAQEHGFRVSGHRLIVYGICDECAKAKRRIRRPVDLI